MITHAEPIKVARRAVLVRGNLRISMLVSIGFVEWTPAKGYCHGAARSIRVSMDCVACREVIPYVVTCWES